MADRGQRGDGVNMYQISISNRSRSPGGWGWGGTTGCYSVCVSVACVSSNTDNDKAAISRERKNLKKTTHTGVEVK